MPLSTGHSRLGASSPLSENARASRWSSALGQTKASPAAWLSRAKSSGPGALPAPPSGLPCPLRAGSVWKPSGAAPPAELRLEGARPRAPAPQGRPSAAPAWRQGRRAGGSWVPALSALLRAAPPAWGSRESRAAGWEASGDAACAGERGGGGKETGRARPQAELPGRASLLAKWLLFNTGS